MDFGEQFFRFMNGAQAILERNQVQLRKWEPIGTHLFFINWLRAKFFLVLLACCLEVIC